ncbi:MAG: hypothetical protein HY393_03820 [Candidatus Diapherotrites archaeon]|nr:hypothetical protein [Candidatus Diapherotrites archaeon]
MRVQTFLILFLMGILLAPFVFGHETGEEEPVDVHAENVPVEASFTDSAQLAEFLSAQSLNVAGIAALILLGAVAYAVRVRPLGGHAKKMLFLVILVTSLLTTAYLAGSTLYLNAASFTQGPVHWHADFEVWNCSEKLDLKDPEGFSNKEGEELVHEHGDDRVHVEGALLDETQGQLGYFFKAVGAEWNDERFGYPTNQGDVVLPAKGTCNGRPAELQFFLYRIVNPGNARQWVYKQYKLSPHDAYETVMAPYGNVPPGDCLIVEFDAVKERSEHVCSSYAHAIQRGELNGR